MGTNDTTGTNAAGISRRSFLGGAAGLGALAALGLSGCAPKAAGTAEAENASSAAGTTAGVADNNAVAVDDGSAAITVDWLGAAPETGDIAETKDTDLLIVGAGNGGMIAGAYASDQKMDFILCEKGTEVGATRHWFNAVDTKPFTDQGYHTDRARLHGEWARYSSGTCDHNLINMWMNESNDMFEYVDQYAQARPAPWSSPTSSRCRAAWAPPSSTPPAASTTMATPRVAAKAITRPQPAQIRGRSPNDSGCGISWHG